MTLVWFKLIKANQRALSDELQGSRKKPTDWHRLWAGGAGSQGLVYGPFLALLYSPERNKLQEEP